MNNDERARILRMVSEGQLSPEEAAGLLEALEPAREPKREREHVQHGWRPGPEFSVEKPRRRARAVVIQIREGGENKVNIRIPMSLATAAGKFIPRQAQKYLSAYEIDLNEFLAGAEGTEGGTLLEVKDGENRVLIAVE